MFKEYNKSFYQKEIEVFIILKSMNFKICTKGSNPRITIHHRFIENFPWGKIETSEKITKINDLFTVSYIDYSNPSSSAQKG